MNDNRHDTTESNGKRTGSETAEEYVMRRIGDSIGALEELAAEHSESMANDYRRFFCRHAEEAYITQCEMSGLRELLGALRSNDGTSCLETLESETARLTDSLLDRQPEKDGSNRMDNIAYVLELRVAQRLRRFYIGLVWEFKKRDHR